MENESSYDVIVVGAGAAGLTSAAYLCKYGYRVLLCEKEEEIGGLVSSFNHNGFHFDSGVRAFANSGIIFPMLEQLEIEMESVKSKVSVGIEDNIIDINSRESLWEYEEFLGNVFPQNKDDIHNIIMEIQQVMKYMDVIYGIDNPLFLDYSENLGYIFKTLLPWIFRYQINIKKAMELDGGVNNHLLKFTENQSLIDIITQHFFKNTPTFFALSYFGLYLDYSYPLGGTSVLSEKLSDYIKENNGDILIQTEVTEIDIQENNIKTIDGKIFNYRKLVWAGDTSTLYNISNTSKTQIQDNENIQIQKDLIEENHGGDYILTIYLGTNLDRDYLRKHCGEHLFYTPKSVGLSAVNLESWDKFGMDHDLRDKKSKLKMKSIIASYLEATTFEISCPALRDENLAPEGKTGLIISTLIDYKLVKRIKDAGWYEEFKNFCIDETVEILNNSILKDLKENIIFSICSTPLTIERFTGNLEGAITGWAFNNDKIPSETRFTKINNSVLTPIPDIYQAGQWTFSPSGVPISILTGKLAADEIDKKLKKQSKRG